MVKFSVSKVAVLAIPARENQELFSWENFESGFYRMVSMESLEKFKEENPDIEVDHIIEKLKEVGVQDTDKIFIKWLW